MPSTFIRPAQVADADAIARVHVDSWRTSYKGIVPDDVLAGLSVERRAQVWRTAMTDFRATQCLYVAESSKGIVGFANGGYEREHHPAYRGELYAIYLLQSAQGQRVGQRLVQAVARHLSQLGLPNMLAWVLSENPARQFYEHLGAQYISEKPILIGTATLKEVAYGWSSLQTLVH
jgi:GNAT superfamily N-acetyltransferase